MLRLGGELFICWIHVSLRKGYTCVCGVTYERALVFLLLRLSLLTRDPRVVERKKYGKAKARRSFQFSKR